MEGILQQQKRKNQILYQKTYFNAYKICQLPCIFKCCKCKKNNSILQKISQLCIFCGTPNYINKK